MPVDKQVDKQKVAQAELNRRRSIPISKTVMFCGTQGRQGMRLS
jgi:hypothetical protein